MELILEDEKRTIGENELIEITDENGSLRIVQGPCTIRLKNSRLRFLHKYEAGPDQYLEVKHKSGNMEHIRGPAEQYFFSVYESIL
eukprot:gene55624-74276_t